MLYFFKSCTDDFLIIKSVFTLNITLPGLPTCAEQQHIFIRYQIALCYHNIGVLFYLFIFLYHASLSFWVMNDTEKCWGWFIQFFIKLTQGNVRNF